MPMLDSSLWRLDWQGNFEAFRPTPDTYKPIPPVNIPIEFEKPFLAISTSSFNALPKWFTAGWISQKIYTGLTVSGTSDAVASNQRVLLNRLSILEFPTNLSSSYSLTFYFPTWIVDLSIGIWQYQGDISDTNDVTNRLQRIEQKIDDIATFGGQ